VGEEGGQGGDGVKAVVLAAGEGVRLRPLTLTRPKHLLPVGGRPLLEHILLSLRGAGLDEAVLVVHHMADRIMGYFGDGSEFGLKLEYAHQPGIRGTADAILPAEAHVDRDFLLIYGDLLVTPDAVRQVLQLHQREKPAVSLAAVPAEHPERYGILKLQGNRVVEIVEKPSPEEAAGHPVNAGIYVLPREIFESIRRTEASLRGEYELTDSLRLLIREGQVVAAAQIPPEGWLDVGRPWDLLEANRRVLDRMRPGVLGQVEEGAHLIGPVGVEEGARVRSGAYIEGPALIGGESDIGPNCYIRPHTSIGGGVRLGNACEVKNSILMDMVHIGHLTYVGDSIVGEGCNLGAGSITANLRLDEGTVRMRIKGELVDTEQRKLGVILGDQVKAGINSLFMPGVKVGPRAWIGPNVVVSRDIPPDSLILLKQEVEERKRGNRP